MDRYFCISCLMWTTKIDTFMGWDIHGGVHGCGARVIPKEQYKTLKIHFDLERKKGGK